MEQQLVEKQVTMEMSEMTPRDVTRQVQLIQEVMKYSMKDGEHYGTIPGCGNKPTLLKAGAEKLLLTFRLAPKYEDVSAIETDDLISYRIRCSLTHISTGAFVGSGLGTCNSREKKYKSRDAWDMQNTLYKMACKRALVAAVLNATAASDIFTQDIEDGNIVVSEKPPVQQPKAKENGAVITEPQRKRLFAIAKQSGCPETVIKAHLGEFYGIESTKDIRRSDYEAICSYVEEYKPLEA